MAQANPPEKLDPQDIVKLLVALHRAMKNADAGRASAFKP